MLAVQNLQDKSIFLGCCHVRVNYSSLTELTVPAGSTRAKDFTIPGATNTSFPANPAFPGLTPPGLPPPFFPPPPPGSAGSHYPPSPYATPYQTMPPMTQQPYQPAPTISPVVLVSHLPTDVTLTPDHLFNIFSLFGDILRIKILFNKRDNALVQYQHPQAAQWACQYMNKFPVYNHSVHCNESKYFEVKLQGSEEELHLSKDYAGSKVNRYKGQLPQPKQLMPPSQVLFVSNFPDHTTSQELTTALGTMTYISYISAHLSIHIYLSVHSLFCDILLIYTYYLSYYFASPLLYLISLIVLYPTCHYLLPSTALPSPTSYIYIIAHMYLLLCCISVVSLSLCSLQLLILIVLLLPLLRCVISLVIQPLLSFLP